MKFLPLFALITLLSPLTVVQIQSERILFLLPLASKSHKNVFQPLIEALAKKGHQVTVASPLKPAKASPNIKEIVPVPYEKLFQELPSPFDTRKLSKLGGAALNQSIIYEACERVYDVQEFSDLGNQKFDLLVVNGFLNDCFAGLIHRIGAPFILLTTIATPAFIAENVGNRLPSSFIPNFFVDYSDEMSFKERVINSVFDMFLRMRMRENRIAVDGINRKHFGDAFPGVEQVLVGTSLILSNSYFPLNYPRPLLPDIVEIGGMHCRPAQPLPKEMDTFLSGAEHGFILFSMGSILKTDQMPDEMRQTFLKVFSRLKQRVIWKWNSGHMDNLPPNVMLSPWVPQQDVLAHPKIQVFMSHGGLLSTQEAAYHGVPVLGIPMFGDQDLNVKQAVKNGYAVMLEILDLTEELLEDRLTTLLNDPRFSSKAKQLSGIIKDQPQTPLDRAVFWTEYVIRHKGAPHLRSAARKLNYIQYHSLDVVAFLLLILTSALALSFISCRFCYRKACGGGRAAAVGGSKKKQ